jgi:uncharacterized membrane protein YdbT with pleckstrin-like domain
MRGTNAVVFTALLLAGVGVLAFAPAARWLSIVLFAAAIFFAWRMFSSRGVREEEARTHTSGRENRLR